MNLFRTFLPLEDADELAATALGEARRAAGITHHDLATDCGCTDESNSRGWCNGTKAFTLGRLIQVRESVFDVLVERLRVKRAEARGQRTTLPPEVQSNITMAVMGELIAKLAADLLDNHTSPAEAMGSLPMALRAQGALNTLVATLQERAGVSRSPSQPPPSGPEDGR